MGLIDVTDILSDPDMVDPLTIIRRLTDVNEFGENVLSEQKFPTYGSVQPASGRTIQRLPEAMRVAGVFSFFVQGQIISDGVSKYPDLIEFNRQRYAVQVVFPYTNWGAGYSEGTCVRERPTG